MKTKFAAIAAMALSAVTALSGAASAQYPDRPVTFVVPWPEGRSGGVLTGLIAREFTNMFGAQANVVHRPGGPKGPFPGAQEVAAAAPDGYTIGSLPIAVPVIGPLAGVPGLSPNPFDPVGVFLTNPLLIAVKNDAPFDSMAELAAYAKDNPVRYGHFGDPLIPTRVTKKLAGSMGFSFSEAQAFDNPGCDVLLSGNADVINSSLSGVADCLPELNVLAVLTDERLPLFPDVPTVGELEPNLKIALWTGLFVPKGTPAHIVDIIEAAALAAINSSDALGYASALGAPLYWQNRDEARAQIEADIRTMKYLAQ